jgi:hypothetical protein
MGHMRIKCEFYVYGNMTYEGNSTSPMLVKCGSHAGQMRVPYKSNAGYRRINCGLHAIKTMYNDVLRTTNAGITRYHAVSRRSHEVSRGLTQVSRRSHEVSRGLTRSHEVSRRSHAGLTQVIT